MKRGLEMQREIENEKSCNEATNEGLLASLSSLPRLMLEKQTSVTKMVDGHSSQRVRIKGGGG
jgi:hypothetical protein